MIIGLIGNNIQDNLLVAKIFQYFTLKDSLRSITIEEWINNNLCDTYMTSKSSHNQLIIKQFNEGIINDVSSIFKLPYYELINHNTQYTNRHIPDCLLKYEFKSLKKRSKINSIEGVYNNGVQLAKLLSYIEQNYPNYKEGIDYQLLRQSCTIEEFINDYKQILDAFHSNMNSERLFKDYVVVYEQSIGMAVSEDGNLVTEHIGVLPNWIVVDCQTSDELFSILYNYNYNSKLDKRVLIDVYRNTKNVSDDNLVNININMNGDLNYIVNQIKDIIIVNFKDKFYV